MKENRDYESLTNLEHDCVNLFLYLGIGQNNAVLS